MTSLYVDGVECKDDILRASQRKYASAHDKSRLATYEGPLKLENSNVTSGLFVFKPVVFAQEGGVDPTLDDIGQIMVTIHTASETSKLLAPLAPDCRKTTTRPGLSPRSSPKPAATERAQNPVTL